MILDADRLAEEFYLQCMLEYIKRFIMGHNYETSSMMFSWHLKKYHITSKLQTKQLYFCIGFHNGLLAITDNALLRFLKVSPNHWITA